MKYVRSRRFNREEFDLYPCQDKCCLYAINKEFIPRYQEISNDEFLRFFREVASIEQQSIRLIEMPWGKVAIQKTRNGFSCGTAYVRTAGLSNERADEKIRNFCLEVLFKRALVIEGDLDKMSEFGRRVGPDSGEVSVLLQAMGFHSFFQMPNCRQWIVENSGESP